MSFNRRRFLQTALILGLMPLAACSRTRKFSELPAGSRVLALGDSLTAGHGAAAGQDYPAQLAQISGWAVINGGVSGDTSAEALQRLPELLKERPELVLIGIGGNDFLRKLPESETRRNVREMVDLVREKHIDAVLIAEPHFTTGAVLGFVSDHPMYAELAEELNIPLFADGWSEILSDKKLTSDPIHANAKGYRVFAEALASFLTKQGWLA
ncbi:GDSL-type esterase/lipase family protein [Stenoxybacter acetivorans]|uniref:GDSL-type esterase/lipase family protein n=1 Tax=Stenoxybacter acetivorans TaxID=422441 RepID=UPI00056CAEFD|nr:GDSL-type esterase/lipase family protein [Stenoxybacter acetivorans]